MLTIFFHLPFAYIYTHLKSDKFYIINSSVNNSMSSSRSREEKGHYYRLDDSLYNTLTLFKIAWWSEWSSGERLVILLWSSVRVKPLCSPFCLPLECACIWMQTQWTAVCAVIGPGRHTPPPHQTHLHGTHRQHHTSLMPFLENRFHTKTVIISPLIKYKSKSP